MEENNRVPRQYNMAGKVARAHYQSSDDPCGYVTDNPNPVRTAINETVDAALQRTYEIRETQPDMYARSLRIYNLIREMAALAGRLPDGQLNLRLAQIRKMFSAL